MKIKSQDIKKNIWQYIFYIILGISLISMIFASQDAGISGDEFFHTEHAEHVFNFYKTKGEDKTATIVTQSNNLPLYGQLIDNIAHGLGLILNVDDYMALRHGLNSIVGWLAILFVGLFAKRVGGWKAGIISVILMLVSPRFIGHSFNNLKDIPFAAASMMSIYYIVKFLDELPKRKYSTMIMLALSIAFAIDVRAGGLIVIAYFALFAVVYYIWKYKTLKKEFAKVLLWSLGIVVVGYFLAVLFWPYALVAPIENPISTLKGMTNFNVSLRQVFEGQAQWSDALPWYYTPKFILITIPLAVIAGSILGFVMMFRDKKKWFYYFVLIFTFIFPIFWIVINKSNVYGGWRHAIFAYPPMVALAGIGISQLIDSFSNKYIKIITTSAFGLLLINPIAHIIRNHPYEYVYFNSFVSGMNGAYANYELDYYYHSLREASDWVKENAVKDKLTTGNKIVVACWHMKPINYYFRHDTAKFQMGFIRYNERGEVDWDYAIICNTGISPEQIQNRTFPPHNTVYEVKVDGKPICVVIKREDKSDMEGFALKSNGQLDKAIALFQQAIKHDPKNETALINLSEIYLRKNIADSVLIYTNQILEYNPKSEQANYFKAYALLAQNKDKEALSLCDKVIKDNYKYSAAYTLAANIKLKQNDLYGAETYLNGLVDIDRFDEQTMQQLLAIYQAYGLDQRNSYVKLYSLLADHYRKVGNKDAAKEYEDAINQLYNSRQ